MRVTIRERVDIETEVDVSVADLVGEFAERMPHVEEGERLGQELLVAALNALGAFPYGKLTPNARRAVKQRLLAILEKLDKAEAGGATDGNSGG